MGASTWQRPRYCCRRCQWCRWRCPAHVVGGGSLGHVPAAACPRGQQSPGNWAANCGRGGRLGKSACGSCGAAWWVVTPARQGGGCGLQRVDRTCPAAVAALAGWHHRGSPYQRGGPTSTGQTTSTYMLREFGHNGNRVRATRASTAYLGWQLRRSDTCAGAGTTSTYGTPSVHPSIKAHERTAGSVATMCLSCTCRTSPELTAPREFSSSAPKPTRQARSPGLVRALSQLQRPRRQLTSDQIRSARFRT